MRRISGFTIIWYRRLNIPLTRKSLNEELIAEKEKELTIVRKSLRSKKNSKNYGHWGKEAKRFEGRTTAVKTGLSFKIGRFLTWIPRKLLGRP